MLYVAALVASAALTLVLTPAVKFAALTLGLVDAPGGRKVHLHSVPRLGGLAIVIGASLVLLGVSLVSRPTISDELSLSLGTLWPVLAGSVLIFSLGLVDDVWGVGVGVKLFIQAAAALVVMVSGSLIERVTVGTHTIELHALAWVLTLLWIVGLTNAFNLIDGLDGLAAGVAAIAGTACAVILMARGHTAEAILLTALVGGALGFLPFNFPPASIFLGDGGSLVFGFVLATTAITGWQKGATALAAGVPLLIFALPLADTVSTLVRRARRRPGANGATAAHLLRRLVEPDRDHIHHRLEARGWSRRNAVLLLYLATLVLSGVALATAQL